MNRLIQAICLILLVFSFSLSFFGELEAKTRQHRPKRPQYADIVMEAETGYILRSRSRNAYRYPASLTKMMTLYLVFQAIENGRIRLKTKLPVTALAARQPATKIGLRVGQRLRVYDAVMSLVTQSANDAAVVLAEGVGGSVPKFVRLMNKQAKALGMNRTRFRNPSGLPDKRQLTTANDMAILAHALIHHYPGFYPYFSRQSHRYAGRKMNNHNNLLDCYEGMDGIKTGYTNASGFNLASSAKQRGVRLIGIIFGGRKAASRDKQMKVILDKSFKAVRKPSVRRILAKGERRRNRADYISLPTKIAAAFPSKKKRHHKKLALAKPRVAPSAFTRKPPVNAAQNEPVWGLQIGAFGALTGAQKALEETAKNSGPLLEEAEQSLQKITMTDGSTVYRARFLGVDKKTARSVCSLLIKTGQNCIVVSGI
ncbi:MAG TPA: D-alanyl-D-alanine carboxypeptidase [Rhodospirillaceae bacterium]|nr:D-alanyl-D-alanine carboxypeptidase [Rhodospirillaceae bacterium]